ncbi:MAG TPA: NADP-dependent malic enzyme [Candidatus Thiothrix moscowensis]|uniref:NADP-dependent malic enzyme n=1 Tax=unclassified Thiothrix TaxID=2636184 RepID=UPI002600202F|nr:MULTISPECIES: NADP-dependent malic enzyme [unclassified Thiothrix]HRJ53975.1 NADP-dependent malic enzyme [Candidatus Thiothrix moscowensis]HRJ94057.1 NADP-dependent malic enzyme [Candidatus Thiothrix moscowensis]
MVDELNQAALDYHRYPNPGKLEVTPTKNMVNQRDLALAYSPGVAAASLAIADNPACAANYTTRGNLVAVVSNGTAVLGLGSIGALASKPVMEGKAVLFKKFAGVNAFDIELDTLDVDKLVEAVALMEPTFGGINLEDIKAPECFEVEKRLKARMKIPVFHDDQHGTAICVAAAIRNGLRVAGKNIQDVKLVCSGAGAAAIACLNLLVEMGLKKENITVNDRFGIIYTGRVDEMNPYNSAYAIDTDARTLDDVMDGVDVFLGLSAPRVLKQHHVKVMAANPLILALANPEPEIRPELVYEVRSDAIIATGRSDYPNQVNNVLCFPFLFRGALDVGATEINEAMKIAVVEAIGDLAMREASDAVVSAYGGAEFHFGRDYLIPKPFDPRLMTIIPPRVAKAAMDSGVATRPIADFDAYQRQLESFVFRSGMTMKPVFEKAKRNPQRIVFAEGESQRVINAVQILVDDGICKPILLGNPELIQQNINAYDLRLTIGENIEVVDPRNNPDFERHVAEHYAAMCRKGVTPAYSRRVMAARTTQIAAVMVRCGDADAMICGVEGNFISHLHYVRDLIGARPGLTDVAAVTMLILKQGTYFLTDTHAGVDPTAEQLADNTALAAELVAGFGMEPKAALLSHSNFGSRMNEHSDKMRKALAILHEKYPHIVVEGEMHADAALSQEVRDRLFKCSAFEGSANLLVCPDLNSANIAYNMTKMLADGLPVGPMLVGTNYPAHILTESTTVRGIVNMAAFAAVEAASRKQ